VANRALPTAWTVRANTGRLRLSGVGCASARPSAFRIMRRMWRLLSFSMFAASVAMAQTAGLPAAASGDTLYTATPLGSLGDGFTVGSAINDAGQITGKSRNSNGFRHAFLSSNGSLTDLGVLPGGVASTGTGINNSGQITGYASTSGPAANHAFLFSNGNMADLGTLGGMTSIGRGINDSGHIGGDSVAGGVDRAFLYANGVMTPILEAESQGTAINASGQIAGQFATASGFFHAFVYTNGVTADLGTLGGAVSVGEGINNTAQIVGRSLVAGGPQHAFIYSNGGMVDLNSVVVNSLSGFTLMDATAINDWGQIVATALNSASQAEAFLLTPVPEPSSALLIAGGLLIGSGVMRGRTRGDDDRSCRPTRTKADSPFSRHHRCCGHGRFFQ